MRSINQTLVKNGGGLHPGKELLGTDPKLADLYRRIQAFQIDDPGSAFAFSARLARENGWSVGYAKRVIEEYKKFMFLAVAAGHSVTPSEEVDQAWHLHLLYTRSYWTEFCKEVLGTVVHHGPTRGGQQEQQKFGDWYQHTLESYERFFGHWPPTDIWPDPVERFSDFSFRRVSLQRNWIFPKPSIRRLRMKFLIGLLAAILISLGLFALDRESKENVYQDGAIQTTDQLVEVFRTASGFSTHQRNLTANPQTTDRDGYIWIVVVAFIVIVCAISAIFSGKCPKCNERRALEKTGEEKDDQIEWQCKYCSHQVWKDKETSTASGGCGGCGGCGDCGGCG